MGRHREFDLDQALDAVLCVFWRKGYEGASYNDLTAAAGVERPALYAAFGNKEAMFRKALDRYYDHYMDFIPDALAQPTAYQVIHRMLYGALELHTRYPDHSGCLGINGALAVSDEAEPVRRALIESRANGHEKLAARLRRARDEGDLPWTSNPESLATFILAVSHGMAVQAKAGFDRHRLAEVAEYALAAMPETRDAAGKTREPPLALGNRTTSLGS